MNRRLVRVSATNHGGGTQKRRRLQFRLLTLLVLVTMFAVWLGYVSTRARRVRNAVFSLSESGARIGFDYQYDGLRENIKAEPWAPGWLRGVVGDEYFVDVAKISFQGNRETTSRDLDPIRSLTAVRRIDLDYTIVDDISALRNQTQLLWLDLEETKIDSEDLVHLENLNDLRILVLTRTLITDDGLEHVSDMTRLRALALNETRVTDKCLVHFEQLKGMSELDLSDTDVTESGVRSLQGKLPNCKIEWSGIPSSK